MQSIAIKLESRHEVERSKMKVWQISGQVRGERVEVESVRNESGHEIEYERQNKDKDSRHACKKVKVGVRVCEVVRGIKAC